MRTLGVGFVPELIEHALLELDAWLDVTVRDDVLLQRSMDALAHDAKLDPYCPWAPRTLDQRF